MLDSKKEYLLKPYTANLKYWYYCIAQYNLFGEELKMNFSFFFNKDKQNEGINSSVKNLTEVVDNFNKAMKDGLTQYNETRKKAEEQINRGIRITKHRINL